MSGLLLVRSTSNIDILQSNSFAGSRRKRRQIQLLSIGLVVSTFLLCHAFARNQWYLQSLPAIPVPVRATRDTDASILYSNISFPLCFVHIGKTSGSTVSCSLGLGYADCQNKERQHVASKTQQQQQQQQQQLYYFHLRQQTCPASTKTYVITVRHPLTRILSWFDFERTSKPHRTNPRDQERIRQQRAFLFDDCYPDDVSSENAGSGILALARNGLQPLGDNETLHEQLYQMPCNQRAWAAILGAREVSYHEYFNYEYYWLGMHQRKRDNNATIIVLRAEHLQKDWTAAISAEPLLGRLNENAAASSSSRDLPADAIDNLCRALCHEFQYYIKFLLLADNLAAHQVEESVREVQAQCPDLDIGDELPCSDLPNFPPLYLHDSQYKRMIKKRFYRSTE